MRIGAAVLVLGLVPGIAAAQDSTKAMTVQERVAAAMRVAYRKMDAAECSADKGLHFKVSSAKVYLKTGIETSIDENKNRALASGERVALEAITQNGQDKSAGAWYYLGRIYLQKGDVVGADSAFKRAVALAPDCASDVDKYRHTAWIALINPGIEFLKAEKPDSAQAWFTLANRMYGGAPHAYYYSATIAFDRNDMPTALAYFDSALAVPADPKNADIVEQASFNKAVVLLRMNRAPEAVALLQGFVAKHPDDINAKKALMSAYQSANMPDSVNAIAKQLEAAGETVARTTDTVATKSPFNDAANAFNAQKWDEAARIAQQVVATEPYNRDALYMLVASEYQLKKGAELVRYGKQFVGLDPASESGLQMLGYGYNLTRDSRNAVATRIQLNGLPFGISGASLTPTDGGATFTAKATGRTATDATAKPVAPHAATLVVEFLNSDGAAVATSEVAVPALKTGETFDVSAAGQGSGIVAWRYRIK